VYSENKNDVFFERSKTFRQSIFVKGLKEPHFVFPAVWRSWNNATLSLVADRKKLASPLSHSTFQYQNFSPGRS